MRLTRTLLPTMMLLAASSACTAEQDLPQVAVCNTEVWGVDLQGHSIDRLSDRLAAKLHATRKFQVLPREQTDALVPPTQVPGSLLACPEQACLVSMLAGRGHVLLMKLGLEFAEYEQVRKKALAHPQVLAAVPFVMDEAIITSDRGFVAAVVEGSPPGSVGFLAGLDRNLAKPLPAPDRLPSESMNQDLPGIIIGQEMALRLMVKRGDRIYLSSPRQMVEGKDGLAPKTRPFVVVGTFTSGMLEWDEKFAFITFAKAQAFFKLEGSVTGVHLFVRDLSLHAKTADQVIESLGGHPYKDVTFLEMNKPLLQSLALEKKGQATKADKTLITQVIKTEAGCQVAASLYDLKSASLERSVTVDSGCLEASLLNAMGALALMLGGT